jgi:hypothetical protein
VHHALFVLRHGRPDAYRWPPEPRATATPVPLSPGAATEHAGAPPGRPARRLLGWALAVAILAGCLLLIDPGEIAAALRHLSLAELAVLLLLATLDRLLMGLRWGVLLRLAGVRLPLLRAVRLFYRHRQVKPQGDGKRRSSLELQTYAAALAPVISAQIANACARTAR